MNILRIADTSNSRTGGMARAMYGSGDILASQDHTVDYLYAEDMPTTGTVRRRRLILPYIIPSLIQSSIKIKGRYDAVEIHEPLAAPYCLLRRINNQFPPVVVYSHGLEERGMTAERAYFRNKRIPYSRKERYSPVVFSRLAHSKYAVRHCDHFVGCNSEDIAYLRASGVSAARLTRLSNGIEDAFLAAGQVGAQLDRNGILFVGSWITRKGVLDLVPAVSQAMRRHPTVRFTVAGCGCPAATVLGAFDSDLRARVLVTPKVTDNEVLIQLYREHSIFLLPSYFEGQPLAMLEAAALGMGIVTTNVCGMADFIIDGCKRLCRAGRRYRGNSKASGSFDL